jgi:hypothetical protein
MNDDTTKPPATAQLAHEALIRSWSRFAEWVNTDAAFQRWLAIMEDRAKEDELLPESRIREAEHWLTERPDDIPVEIQKLIKDSTTLLHQRITELEEARTRAEKAAHQAEDARHQAEDARHQALEAHNQRQEAAMRTTRRLRQFVAVLIALLIVAVGGILFAFQQRATAQA